MWRAVLKGLLAHKLRLALTALAVVLGVAFVSGTLVFTDTIDRVFEQLFGESAKGVDAYVRSRSAYEGPTGPDRQPMPEAILETVRGVDGVAEAVGSVDGYAQIIGPDGEPIAPMAPTIGISWAPPPLTPLTMRAGRAPESAGEVAIDAQTAADSGFAVGDTVQVITPAGVQPFRLAGIVGFGEADNLAGATLAVFSLGEAQRLFGLSGQLTEVRVKADAGIAPGALVARLQAALPAEVEAAEAAVVARQQADAIGEALGFLRTGLLVFAAVALFVGSFIIANTFAIVVAQRSREFALLRALGASRGQVLRAVLAEALAVGIGASLVGVALGALLARGIQGLLRAFGLSLPSGDLVLAPRTIGTGVLLGTVVTLIAAVLPARRAARIPPVAALRLVDRPHRAVGRGRIVGGAVTLALGVALMGVGLSGSVANGALLTGAAVVAVFVGVALLSPLLAGVFMRILGAPAARRGVPGRLARDSARANPRRTAATASALMIGLALVGFVATFAASLRASAVAAVDNEIRADFVLRGPQAQIGIGFSPAVANELAALPEVAAVSRLRIGTWRDRADAGNAFLYGIDPATIQQVADLDLRAGSLAGLDARSVLIETGVAEDRGLAVGDRLAMTFARSGREELRVAGVFAPSAVFDSGFLIANDGYAQRFQQVLDHTVLVRGAKGVEVERLRAAVEAVTARYPGIEADDQTEFKERQKGQVDQLLGLVTALLLLAVGIALIGITNTLALSVFERTREIGLLRAVGMTRRQVRAMIRWEALLVSVMGAVLGAAMGALFGWAVVRSLGDDGISELVIPYGQLLGGLVAAGIAGVVAGLLPARRAARLDVLDAVSHD